MRRRIWIKQVVVAGMGSLLVPGCMNDEGAISVTLNNISVTPTDERLLAEVVDAIIPATNSPGAKDLNLHQFVLKMVDDCCDKPAQEKFVNGLKKFNAFSKKNTEQGFTALNTEKKLVLLKGIHTSDKMDGDLKIFLALTRKFVIKGYETSEYVLTKLLPYTLAPGHFYGCVKIDKGV